MSHTDTTGSAGDGLKLLTASGATAVPRFPTTLSVLKPAVQLAWPVLVTYLLTFGIPVTTLIFVGRLGEAELAVRRRVALASPLYTHVGEREFYVFPCFPPRVTLPLGVHNELARVRCAQFVTGTNNGVCNYCIYVRRLPSRGRSRRLDHVYTIELSTSGKPPRCTPVPCPPTPTQAAGLATMLANVTGFSIGIGLLTAFDSLGSQAFGAGNLPRVGVLLQRSFVALASVCVPVRSVESEH